MNWFALSDETESLERLGDILCWLETVTHQVQQLHERLTSTIFRPAGSNSSTLRLPRFFMSLKTPVLSVNQAHMQVKRAC